MLGGNPQWNRRVPADLSDYFCPTCTDQLIVQMHLHSLLRSHPHFHSHSYTLTCTWPSLHLLSLELHTYHPSIHPSINQCIHPATVSLYSSITMNCNIYTYIYIYPCKMHPSSTQHSSSIHWPRNHSLFAHTYIHTYIHACMHTHTHTHLCTHGYILHTDVIIHVRSRIHSYI